MEKQLETPATSKVRKPYGSYYLLDLRNMEQSTSFGLSFEENRPRGWKENENDLLVKAFSYEEQHFLPPKYLKQTSKSTWRNCLRATCLLLWIYVHTCTYMYICTSELPTSN